MLRGALAYDYHLEYWWQQMSETQTRRRCCIDALQNEPDEPTAERALSLLLADSGQSGETEKVAPEVLERLVEIAAGSKNWNLRQDALTVLERLVPHKSGWRAVGISEQSDEKLAALALDESSLGKQAARIVGRVASLQALQTITRGADASRVLAALREIRLSAGRLPRQVPSRLRSRITAMQLRDQMVEDTGGISLPRLLMGFAAGVLAFLMLAIGLFWQQSAQLRDVLLEPQSLSNIVTIVAVDDASLEKYGRWDSWPRSLHAELIDRLSQAGAKAIVFDFLFDSVTGDDALLTQAMQRSGKVVLTVLCEGDAYLDRPGAVRFKECIQPQPGLLAASAASGHANVVHDPDGYVRQVPTVVELDSERVPVLALAALQVFTGGDQPSLVPENGILSDAGRQIPVDGYGRLEIYFVGPPSSPDKATFPTVSYTDVLGGNLPVEAIKGKIILVGITATAVPDRYLTPVSHGRPMYGIEILANVIEAVWTGRFIRHPSLLANAVILICLGILTGLLCVRPWIGIISAAGLAVLYFLLAGWFFDLTGIMLELFYPWVVIGASYVMVTAYRYSIETRQRRKVLQLLEKRGPTGNRARLRCGQCKKGRSAWKGGSRKSRC